MPDVTITIKAVDQSSAVLGKIKGELKSLAPGMEKAAESTGSFVKTNAALIGSLTAVGGAALAAGKFVWSSAKAWEESSKINAKVNAVLKSTGNAVGYTSKELDNMANSLARTNGLDDEMVKNGEALMLTFTQVGHQAFPAATQAAIDLSAVLGTDLQGSVIQVGKAMNDFSGYAALKRAGVSFTKEQVSQIARFKETNDLVSYQNLILAELQREFGGAAKEMYDAGLQTEAVSLAFGNLKESIGAEVAPAIKDFNRGLAYTTQGLADVISNGTESKRTFEEYNKILKMNVNTNRDYSGTIEAVNAQMARGIAMTEFYTKTQTEMQEVESKTEEELQLQLNSSLAMTDMKKKFDEQTRELTKSLEAEKATLQALVEQGYKPTSEQMIEQTNKVKELEKAIVKSNTAQSVATKQYASEVLKATGATSAQQLAFAVASGQITQGAANQQQAQEALAQAFVDGTISAESYASNVQQLMDKVKNMNGTKAKMYIDIFIREHTEGSSAQTLAMITQEKKTETGGQGGLHGGAIGDGAASGGQLQPGTWTLVGDRPGGQFVPGVSELIDPSGYIHKSSDAKKIFDSGMIRFQSMAEGGDGPYTSASPILPKPKISYSSMIKGSKVGGGGGGGSAGVLSSAAMLDTESAIVAANQNAAALQVTFQQALQVQQQAVQASNAAVVGKIDELIGVMLSDNPRNIGKQVGYELAKAS